jgi:hypothetical protein
MQQQRQQHKQSNGLAQVLTYCERPEEQLSHSWLCKDRHHYNCCVTAAILPGNDAERVAKPYNFAQQDLADSSK